MPTDGPARPHPKVAATKPGRPRRYRRKAASPKGWQQLRAEKIGPCRVCCDPGHNGSHFGRIQLHHVVSRQDGGDDVAENLVSLCGDGTRGCHGLAEAREGETLAALADALTDAERAYTRSKLGPFALERLFGEGAQRDAPA